MIDEHNYEEYIMMYVDGELDEAAAKELHAYVELHPELEAELDGYSQLKLVPDESLVYKHKKALLQPEPRTIALRPAWMYGAAAGLVLLIALKLVLPGENKEQTSAVATQINDTARLPAVTARQATAQAVAVVATDSTTPTVAREAVMHRKAAANSQTAQKNVVPVMVAAAQEQQPESRPMPVEVAAIKASVYRLRQPEMAIAVTDTVSTPVIVAQAGRKERLLDKLPIDEEKKDGLDEVGKRLTDNVARLQRSLRETSLSLKLGKTEIVSVNF